MERMTGIDPMFIYSDTPETPMEIAYACVFDPSSATGGYSFERVAAVLADRIPTLAPFRRRLVPVPLGLDHPRWVDDPDFDLGNHLHRAALPEPGGEVEFTRWWPRSWAARSSPSSRRGRCTSLRAWPEAWSG